METFPSGPEFLGAKIIEDFSMYFFIDIEKVPEVFSGFSPRGPAVYTNEFVTTEVVSNDVQIINK